MNDLTFQGVSKSFPIAGSILEIIKPNRTKRKKALKNISFPALKTAIIGIMGENGCGKTTLLKLIAGLLIPDAGKISISGKNPLDPQIKKIVGYTTDERSFYWRLTARQNMDFFSSLYKIGKDEILEKSAILFEYLNIKQETYDKRFDCLSSGERKKFILMKTLLHNPQIILLDEPDKNLDSNSLFKFNSFLKTEKSKGKTILYVSHNPNMLKEISDEIILLSNGNIKKHFKNKSEFAFQEAK